MVLAFTALVGLLVAGCGGGAGGGESGSGAEEGDPLKIGLLLSLSGPAAPFGIPERDAAKALVKKINAEGGVGGRDVELAVYDDTTEPTECARGVTKLSQQDVVAIIGGTTGSCTLAAAPVAVRNEVPMLAPNGTIEVTDPEADFYPWVYRTTSNDLLNTKVTFDQAIEHGDRLALFYQEDAYGENTAEYVDELAEEAGVEVVAEASAPLDATDVTSQATKLRNGDADVVLMQVSSPGLGAQFVRAASQVGIELPMWGPIGLGQDEFIESSGPAGEGVNLTVVVNWYDRTDKQQELADLLEEDGLEPAGFGEILSTSGLLAITEAVENIEGDLTGSALRDQLESTCGVTTYAEGELCYSADDHDGWGEDTLRFVTIENGEFTPR